MALPARGRLLALDALRGLAVAGMILVVSPGNWADAYPWLQHAPWEGATPADMVFPTFLFATGFSLGLSFPRAGYAGAGRTILWWRIARRSLLLIGLGLLLNALPWFDLAHLRIPGILQRIALCYALGAGLCLLTAHVTSDGTARLRAGAVGGVILVLLALYWLLLTLVPVPGFGAGRLDPAGNLAAFIDRTVFTVPHLWPYGRDAGGNVVYDPEGLLSTVPATTNLLAGVLAAWWWKRVPARAVPGFVALGLALIALGLLVDRWMPINKRIWTDSFAILSTGVSAGLLGLLAWGMRAGLVERLAWPLRVLGGNAILAFVLSQLLGVFGALDIVGDTTPQGWGDAAARRIVADPHLAALLCAVAILALITLALAPLHRRAIHFRL